MYWGFIGIMEHKSETTTVYWGYIGVYIGDYYCSMVTTRCAAQVFYFAGSLGGFEVRWWLQLLNP